MERKEAASHIYNLAAMGAGIALYEEYDLFVCTIGAIAMLAPKMIAWRATSKRDEKMHYLEKLDWFGFTMLLAFGLPTILLHNELVTKLQGPIFSFIITLFIVGAHLKNTQVVKQITAPVLAKFGYELPDDTWKKIDYWFAASLLLSAAASLGMTFFLPTDIWIYAKNALPIFSLIPMIATYVLLKRHAQPIDKKIEPDALPKPLLQPMEQENPKQPSRSLLCFSRTPTPAPDPGQEKANSKNLFQRLCG